MEYYSILTKKEILTHVTTWMLENEVISLTWKDKYCRFHLCEVPGAVRYTDRNWDVGCLGLGRIGE